VAADVGEFAGGESAGLVEDAWGEAEFSALTRAFAQYDHDRIVPMLWGSLDNHHRHQYITNLKPIFEQAKEDGLNLLSPPPDFHDWLNAPLRLTLRGPGTAKANTISTRYYTLRTLYEHLIREDVIAHNPALGYRVPPGERSSTPLPTAGEVQKLLTYLQHHDPLLYAAATLIHEHALQYTELERLKWSALDFSQGLLLRNRTATRLSNPAACRPATPALPGRRPPTCGRRHPAHLSLREPGRLPPSPLESL